MIFAISGLASAQNGECPDCTDLAQCSDVPCVRDLIAGQQYDSGDVVVWNNESHIFVKYDTRDNWCLEETQVSVTTSLNDVPQTNSGTPKPGQFGYRNDSHGCIDNYTYEIPLNDISLNDCDTVYILTHANVSKLDANGDQFETAWGEGEDFGGNRWAYYFCYTIAPSASIGDHVWEDENEDGIQNDGNAGIPGLEVELYDCDTETIIANTTTNISGFYSFTYLPPGNYSVNFTAPLGFEFTSQNAGNDELDSDVNNVTGNTSCIMLDKGENNDTIDAGLYDVELQGDNAAIGDRVWEDLNGDGIECCGEPGIENVTVGLYYCNGTKIAENETDSEGFYQFTGLNPDEQYYISFTLPSGYEFTKQNVGIDESEESDANVLTGNTSCITLNSGEYNHTIDAGMYQPASIGDFVWEDINGDGIQNNGETGISEVEVSLYNCSDSSLITNTTTNQTGYYNFTGLAPGEYYIGFTAPLGYEFTTMGDGEYFEDSDANPSGNTSCVALTSGKTDNTIDSGLYRPATISNFVWNDTNGNGIQDPDEPGIEGIEIRIYTSDGIYLTNTTTNGSGFYKFLVSPGSYYLNFEKPEGYEFSPQYSGNIHNDSDVNNTGNTSTITLLSGEINDTIDVGIFTPSPNISIEKYTNGKDADNPRGPSIQISNQVKWTYNVTNTGNVNLTNVAVTDTKIGNICTIATLNVSESVTCSATGTAKIGQYSNYGNVTAMYEETQVNDNDPSHYFGYDHWAGVPTANPMLLVGVLGIAMLLFIKREQNKK